MDGNEKRKIADAAEAFAMKHVVELCEEFLEWSDTGILRDGKMRELRAILKPMLNNDASSVAESYAKNAAIKFVVQQGKKD